MTQETYGSTRSATENDQSAITEQQALFQKLAFETLKEMRSRRRWGIFFKLCIVLFVGAIALVIGGIAFTMFSASGDETKITGNHVAVVRLEGAISADSDASAKNVVPALNKAFESSQSVAVILAINSPGGSPVQAGIIYDEITRLRKKYPKKPIYAVAGDVCASAAYYIAAATDDIIVDKASIVGSVGVLLSTFGVTGLMDKLGVERRLYTSGNNKGMLDEFSPTRPDQVEYINGVIGDIHQQFIKAVRDGRGTRLKETPDMFSGLFWPGDRAVTLGLADGFGTVDSVSRDVFKTDTMIDYSQSQKLSDRVLKKLSMSFGEQIRNVLTATAAPTWR